MAKKRDLLTRILIGFFSCAALVSIDLGKIFSSRVPSRWLNTWLLSFCYPLPILPLLHRRPFFAYFSLCDEDHIRHFISLFMPNGLEIVP